MLDLPERSRKPRKAGLTAMIDFGPDGFGWTGPRGVADLLACAAEYIDFAKIYALNSLLLPSEVVAGIVRQYRDAQILPYSGGILFEYALRRNELDNLAPFLRGLGFPALEISENYVELGEDERERAIERFQLEGFTVIYEFGRKNPERPMDLGELRSVVKWAADHGVEHVIVEQSKLIHARKHPELRAPPPRPHVVELAEVAPPPCLPPKGLVDGGHGCLSVGRIRHPERAVPISAAVASVGAP